VKLLSHKKRVVVGKENRRRGGHVSESTRPEIRAYCQNGDGNDAGEGKNDFPRSRGDAKKGNTKEEKERAWLTNQFSSTTLTRGVRGKKRRKRRGTGR